MHFNWSSVIYRRSFYLFFLEIFLLIHHLAIFLWKRAMTGKSSRLFTSFLLFFPYQIELFCKYYRHVKVNTDGMDVEVHKKTEGNFGFQEQRSGTLGSGTSSGISM